jgi:hypothetical protein
MPLVGFRLRLADATEWTATDAAVGPHQGANLHGLRDVSFDWQLGVGSHDR